MDRQLVVLFLDEDGLLKGFLFSMLKFFKNVVSFSFLKGVSIVSRK